MSIALIALKLTEFIPDVEADFIGVDSGALILARKGIRMKLAIGDFDSVRRSDLDLIHQMSEEMIVLNPIKDDSDSESALHHVKEMGYEKIILLGALGGRVDHMLVNLRLAYADPHRVCIQDEQNFMEAYTEGRYVFKKEGYSYISFFTASEALITLESMKYPLHERRITSKDLYTVSNEIIGEEGILIVHKGTVLVIQSKDA